MKNFVIKSVFTIAVITMIISGLCMGGEDEVIFKAFFTCMASGGVVTLIGYVNWGKWIFK